MKNKLLLFVMCMVFGVFASGGLSAQQTLTQSATASGLDDDPTSCSVTLTGAPAGAIIQSMTISCEIGGNCGMDSWYYGTLNLNGTVVSPVCDQTNVPYTQLNGQIVNGKVITYTSADSPDDGYSDDVDMSLSVTVTYILSTNPYVQFTPASYAFGFVDPGTTSAPATITLSGDNFYPAAGNLTVTPSANFEVSLNGTNWFTSTNPLSLPYTGEALASTTLYVRFISPTTPADITGSLTVIGGDVTTYNTIALTGTGNLQYCTSAATNTTDSDIGNVTVGTFSNGTVTSTTEIPGANGTYSDFTALGPINLNPGSTYPISVSYISSGDAYAGYIKAWIDFNRNGIFDETTETVLSSAYSTTNNWVATGTFTVPTNANTAGNGNARLRVSLYESGTETSVTPCGSTSWGEVEDYTVHLVPSGNMTYSSTTVTSASTAVVGTGTENNVMLLANVQTTLAGNPLSVNAIKFNTNGTTQASDIASASLWYSGSSAASSDAEQIGTAIANPSGDFEFTNLAQTLNSGNNYFWLTYSVAELPGYTGTRVLDAELKTVTIGTTVHQINSAPEGSRAIQASLSGTYTVGNVSGANYQTLVAIADDLAAVGMGGDVNIAIVSDLDMRNVGDQRVVFTPTTGSYTLTFYPQGAARTIYGNATSGNGVVGFWGNDNVVVDGRIRNTDGTIGTTNGLTIQNDAAGASLSMINDGDPCQNIEIRNVNFLGFDDSALDAPGTLGFGVCALNEHHNIRIHDNDFKKLQNGIHLQGGAESELTGIVVENNHFGSTTEALRLRRNGVYATYTDTLQIRNNTFDGFGSTVATKQIGYARGVNFYNSVTNAVIDNNVIKNFRKALPYSSTDATTNGATQGIACYSSNATTNPIDNVIISNNRISDLNTYGNNTSVGYGGYNTFGIFVGNVTNTKLLHNTVVLEGTFLNTTASLSGALELYGLETSNLTIKGNIFQNKMTGATTNWAIAVMNFNVANDQFSEVDHNIYMFTDPGTSYFGYWGEDGDNWVDGFGGWQSHSVDAASKNMDVDYLADFHLTGEFAFNSDMWVEPDESVTTDIDGDLRQGTTTQIGADAVVPTMDWVTNIDGTYDGTLCAPQDYPLSVEVMLTGCTDGITRVLPSNPNYQYQWKKNGTNVDNMLDVIDAFGNASQTPVNSGSFTARVENATGNEGETYGVVVSYFGNSITSNTKTLAAEKAIEFTYPTADGESELCRENERTVLQVTANGTINGYQWQVSKDNGTSWQNLAGQTANTLTVELYDATMGEGLYRCAVTGGVNNCNKVANSIVYSPTTNLSVVDPVQASSAAFIKSPYAEDGYIDVCEGTPFVISLDHSMISGDILDYRWEQIVMGEWEAVTSGIDNGDQLAFSNPLPSLSGTYRLVVIGSSRCDTKVAISDPITVNIKPYVTVLQQPKPQLVCAGQEIRLAVKSEGEKPDYQWQKNGVNISVDDNATANKPVFIIDNAAYEDAASYRCEIHVNGCTASGAEGLLYTESALVYVMQETRIITQPTDQYVMRGGDAVFEVRAHAIGEPEDYIADYQWYKGEVALSDDAKYSGAKASLLTVNDVTAEDIAGTYHVTVKGVCGEAETSVEVRIIEANAQFTEMPASQAKCENESVTFRSAVATSVEGSEISYAWHFVDANGVDAILPASTAILEVVANAQTAGNYYVVASLSPMNTSIISSVATLTVNNAPALVTPIANVAVAEGEEATFTAEFSGTQPLQYTWYANGTIVEAATEPTLTVTAGAAGEYTYRVEVTNACGTVTSEAVLTVTAGGKSGVIDNIAGLTVSEMMPNPINGEGNFTIASNSARNANVILMDAAGKQVANIFNGTIDGIMNLRVDAANLSSGAYFLNVTVDGQTITRRVVVAK